MKPIRIFVYADMDSRIARCRARAKADEGLSDRQMKKRILEVDRNRARYYRYYTGQIWGDRSYYDLCINTANTDIKAAAHAVAMMIRARES
jgi:cytidylate kinase